MLPEKKKIVIAGAGFAGVRVALDLAKYASEIEITIIDTSGYHCFHADLYEVGAAILNSETSKEFRQLSGSVNIPLSTIFKGKRVNILVATICEVDLPNKKLSTLERGQIDFDYLVLGLGSTTNYFGIDGAQEYSHPFKNAEDALNVRDDLEELLLVSEKKAVVAIAGGGFTGVELAAELVGYTAKLAERFHKIQPEIAIFEASGTVLPGMPQWAQENATKRLKKLGVNLHLNQPISKVSSAEIFSAEKEAVSYNYLIWTTGVRGASLDGKIKGVETTKRGKILTKSDLSLQNFPNVFVVGDLAECIDPKRNCPLEATAWMGIAEGRLAAKNLIARNRDIETTAFSSQKPIFVVPVGEKYALADLGSVRLVGFSAWVVKRLITLKYLFTILPWGKALTVFLKGVRIYNQND